MLKSNVNPNGSSPNLTLRSSQSPVLFCLPAERFSGAIRSISGTGVGTSRYVRKALIQQQGGTAQLAIVPDLYQQHAHASHIPCPPATPDPTVPAPGSDRRLGADRSPRGMAVGSRSVHRSLIYDRPGVSLPECTARALGTLTGFPG